MKIKKNVNLSIFKNETDDYRMLRNKHIVYISLLIFH